MNHSLPVYISAEYKLIDACEYVLIRDCIWSVCLTENYKAVINNFMPVNIK